MQMVSVRLDPGMTTPPLASSPSQYPAGWHSTSLYDPGRTAPRAIRRTVSGRIRVRPGVGRAGVGPPGEFWASGLTAVRGVLRLGHTAPRHGRGVRAGTASEAATGLRGVRALNPHRPTCQ